MNKIQKQLVALGMGSALALSGAYLVAPFEGKENKAYVDPVGIYTICYGETSGVKKGDYKTDEECLNSLAHELKKHNDEMLEYVKVPLSEKEQAAYLSFAYNVGVGSFSRSTLLKNLNNGNRIEACNQLLRWNKAGGKVLNGLNKRRQAENKMCIEGAMESR